MDEFREKMARSTAIYMAGLCANQSVDVIIDDACVPFNFVDQYAGLFEIRKVHFIFDGHRELLLCGVQHYASRQAFF